MYKITSLDDEYVYYELNKFLAPDETATDAEGFFLTPFKASELNLAMNVSLRCIENKNDPSFLRFQNDRNASFNSNWVKMYLDGRIDNYEAKTITFTKQEINELRLWIKLNEDTIKKHYYQKYDSVDVCKKIKPLQKKSKN